jgi:hypothetical protein
MHSAVAPRIVIADIPAEPPVFHIVKPAVHEVAPPEPELATPSAPVVTIPRIAVADAPVRPPVFPIFKPDIPDAPPPHEHAFARQERLADARPPIFPKAKPASAPEPRSVIARIDHDETAGERDHLRDRVRIASQDSILTTKPVAVRTRNLHVAERSSLDRSLAPIRPSKRTIQMQTTRREVRVAIDQPVRRTRDVKPMAEAPLRLASAHPPESRFDVRHRGGNTASRTGSLSESIAQILAKLTAPVATPAAATTPQTPVVPARATPDDLHVQQAAKAPDRPQTFQTADGRAADGRYPAYAQNDEGYASRQDSDQEPPVRFRARHGRSWDSFRTEMYDRPRRDEDANDDDQGDDDGPGYTPERRDEEDDRGGWY